MVYMNCVAVAKSTGIQCKNKVHNRSSVCQKAGNITMTGNIKILNPETGRMVKTSGKKGQQVIQQYGGLVRSSCVKYHGNPIECQAATDDQCFYTRGKYTDPQGVTHDGQCRKFGFKDFEKAKDSSRKRQGLETQFDKDAAERLYRAYKRKHDPFLLALHEPREPEIKLQRAQKAQLHEPLPKHQLQMSQKAEFMAPTKVQNVQVSEPIKVNKPKKTNRLKGPCFNKEEDMWAAVGSTAGWGFVDRVAQDVKGINKNHGYADLSRTNKKKVRDYVLDNKLQGLTRLEQGCLYTAEADVFTSHTKRGASKRVGEMCPGKYMYDTSIHRCDLRK